MNGQHEEASHFNQILYFWCNLDSLLFSIFWSGGQVLGGQVLGGGGGGSFRFLFDICNSDLKHMIVPLHTTNADIYCNFLFKKILEIIRMKISQILEDQLAGTLQDSVISNCDTEIIALVILISLFISCCIPEHMHVPCNTNKWTFHSSWGGKEGHTALCCDARGTVHVWYLMTICCTDTGFTWPVSTFCSHHMF